MFFYHEKIVAFFSTKKFFITFARLKKEVFIQTI